MTRSVWLIAGLSIFSATGAGEPSKHAGPVTDILVAGDVVYSCSQAGVFRGVGTSIEKVGLSPFRPVALAETTSGILLGGGDPGEAGLIAILNLETERFGSRRIAEDLAYSVTATGNTGFVALADGRVLEFDLDIRAGNLRLRHEHTAAARAVRLSPDGRFLASGGMDRLVIVSDLKRKGIPLAIQDHTGPVECLAFSPDSTRIASGARDGKVRIHTAGDGKLLRTYANLDGEVSAVAWGGNPERLLAGTAKGRIYGLDLSDDTAKVIDDQGADSPVTALAIGPEGNAFAGTLNRVNPVKPAD